MSVMTVLDKIGADFKDVFSFLGSSKGQTIIATGEGLVEAVIPGATGLINLANTWLTEIIKSQAIATAAGQASGAGAQQAAAVLSAVTPQVLQFLQANGITTAPTTTQLEAANTSLVAFANAFATTPATPA